MESGRIVLCTWHRFYCPPFRLGKPHAPLGLPPEPTSYWKPYYLILLFKLLSVQPHAYIENSTVTFFFGGGILVSLKWHQILWTKFAMTTYNIKKLPWLANVQTNLKSEDSSIILYCPECCLTNCHYKSQLKTILVFVNWYQLLSSELGS